MSDITLVDWLADLQEAEPEQNGAATVREIAAQTGRPEAWVRDRLREGIAAGSVEATRAWRTNIAGVTHREIAYRLTDAVREKL